MDDLISRQDALRPFCINTKGERIPERDCDNWQVQIPIAEVKKILKKVPSAEPQIIHCKDCKHYQFADNRAFGMPVKMCKWFNFEDVDDDDFCSFAERIETDK